MRYNDFFFTLIFFIFTELFLRYYYSNSQSWKFFHLSRNSISTVVARKMEKEDGWMIKVELNNNSCSIWQFFWEERRHLFYKFIWGFYQLL